MLSVRIIKEILRLVQSLKVQLYYVEIGRKNIVIDNKTAIASIAKFCADGLETVKSDQMNTSHADLSDPHTESFSVFAYYFSQMIITALNYQETR